MPDPCLVHRSTLLCLVLAIALNLGASPGSLMRALYLSPAVGSPDGPA